ncbi:MAG: hypothetical protein P8X57_09125 [Cyclobacteriaceae bacterium]
MKPFLIIIPILLVSAAFGQRRADTISKEITLQKPAASTVLYVANINGNITVDTYDGSVIRVEAERLITAKSQDKLQKGISSYGLATLDRGDTVFLYLSGICGSENWLHPKSRGSQRSYYTEDCRQDFDFKMDMTIRVPAELNLYLSTINDGAVKVSGVKGTLDLHNVNGPVSADGAEAATIARTINGDVDLDFNRQPAAGSFYSLNGNITMMMPRGFSAKATFKSFNGEIYTNVDQVSQEPVLTNRNLMKKGPNSGLR